ncbi:hypothetical protein GK047_15065 [Paenibacillus sp. SYP-B3998]|uniref:Uncharacterized protein n=1 Tax=Paenibacillus sp. SYP-B3998 TaxID=2678564 RepID=A0A6G3ZYY4_9BACL|nr:stalk domain-containing protein [Paenibacillus sp. SYP-B3998]NEW07325.1 hypothetical protein [Paenibacillus sp. SYP-B3998]
MSNPSIITLFLNPYNRDRYKAGILVEYNVPIRFVAESLGASIAYNGDSKEVIVKQGQLDIVDPNPLAKDNMQVGSLILTKEGAQTKVAGVFKIPRNAQIGANLVFLNSKGEQTGFVTFNDSFDAGTHNFELLGDGDFMNYASTTLHVGYFNGWLDSGNRPPN